MSETLINPNQIRDGIGGKIKILNVVQNGSLYRSDGTKFTNFSGSNYLTVGGVVQNGIFSQTQNVLNFGDFFSTADSWEINGSVVINTLTQYQTLLAGNTSEKNFYFSYSKDNMALDFQIFVDGENRSFVSNAITAGTKYYFRMAFSGTDYKCYVNTDGQTYDNTTLLGTYTSSVKTLNCSYETIGTKVWGGVYPLLSDAEIDLADWNIKKNGEYWWKGVETI